jgi:glucose/arabinose dehydrogenase
VKHINYNNGIKFSLIVLFIAFIFLTFEKGEINAKAIEQINQSANLDSLSLFSKNNKLYDDRLTINSGLPPTTNIFNIKDGYRIEPILWNLTLPSSVAFDEKGNMYVAEAGFAYGGFHPTPRILKVEQKNGNISILIDRNLNGPITDIEYHNKTIYISHRGIISKFDLTKGIMTDIIVGLPSLGDHHNNQVAFGSDNRLYFGQGEATNSGVVGIDNFNLGWLKEIPTFHDVPAKDIVLTGQNFETENPLTADPKDKAITGAFVPFGNATKKGQVIKGDTKCNGCILSANLDGTDLKVVGWGFRSAYGLAFSPDNKSQLLVTVNGADERGSRPIANDSEKIYLFDVFSRRNLGKFHGWPDFVGNAEPITDPKFNSSRSDKPLQFLMQEHPPVEKPFVELDVGAALSQIDFSTSPKNNFSTIDSYNDSTRNYYFSPNMAFIGEFGIMMPISHETSFKEEKIIGQKVIMLNPYTGNYTDFVSLKNPNSNFRPVGLSFNSNENSLYIISIGKVEVISKSPLNGNIKLKEPTPWYYPNTGVVWRVMPINYHHTDTK